MHQLHSPTYAWCALSVCMGAAWCAGLLCACGACLVHTQCSSSMRVVPVWLVCGARLTRVWCSSNLRVVLIWPAHGVRERMVPFWCAHGACLHTWYPSNERTTNTYPINLLILSPRVWTTKPPGYPYFPSRISIGVRPTHEAISSIIGLGG